MLLTLAAIGASTQAAVAASTGSPYARRATVACLQARGAVVGPVRPANSRLRALRDLAQKTSVQAKIGTAVVGIAFGRSDSDALFLIELLSVPKDPLQLERQRNVVLLYPKTASAAHSAVVGCLRS